MIPASGTLIFVIEKIYVALAPIAAETPFVRLGKGVAAESGKGLCSCERC